MDRFNISLFILSTAHPASGLPIGVILTSDEKESTIRCGLKNLIEALPSYAFCGEGAESGPTLCMTDDCGNEKGALRSVWPNSTQLLCIFHFFAKGGLGYIRETIRFSSKIVSTYQSS